VSELPAHCAEQFPARVPPIAIERVFSGKTSAFVTPDYRNVPRKFTACSAPAIKNFCSGNSNDSARLMELVRLDLTLRQQTTRDHFAASSRIA
jgi:hypothetical protein